MKFLLKPFHLCLRIWFYVVFSLPLIVFFPLLFILTLKEKWYTHFYKVARIWSAFVLYTSGFFPVRKNGVFHKKNESFMFIANHVSILDILLMLHTVKNPLVFVGKKELIKIPVFGFFFKKTCIMVDRNSKESRREVFAQAKHKIEQGFSICIYPEGGVPEDESLLLDKFKDGAFRLSINHQLPIVSLVFPDNKKRFSYSFFSGSFGKCRSYILPVTPVKGLTLNNKIELKNKVRNQILEKLQQF